MPNHFHLVVTGELERLSRGMHLLGFRYAQAVRAGLCTSRDEWPWLGGEILADLHPDAP